MKRVDFLEAVRYAQKRKLGPKYAGNPFGDTVLFEDGTSLCLDNDYGYVEFVVRGKRETAKMVAQEKKERERERKRALKAWEKQDRERKKALKYKGPPKDDDGVGLGYVPPPF